MKNWQCFILEIHRLYPCLWISNFSTKAEYNWNKWKVNKFWKDKEWIFFFFFFLKGNLTKQFLDSYKACIHIYCCMSFSQSCLSLADNGLLFWNRDEIVNTYNLMMLFQIIGCINNWCQKVFPAKYL